MSLPFPEPSCLTEQLQNLCYRLAVEMRALYNRQKLKLEKTEADTLYLAIDGKAASASTADSATTAASADHATTADSAKSANVAANADHATEADSATAAKSAEYATTAGTAEKATEANHAASADTASHADSASNADYATEAGSASTALSASSVAWENVTGRPTIGAVASKDTIAISDVVGLQSQLDSIKTDDDDYGSIE